MSGVIINAPSIRLPATPRYESGELDAAGPRHRLSLLSDPWCYERSG